MERIHWKGANGDLSGIVENIIVTYEVKLGNGKYMLVDGRNVTARETVEDSRTE